jgi:GntR family transcriptional regulator
MALQSITSAPIPPLTTVSRGRSGFAPWAIRYPAVSHEGGSSARAGGGGRPQSQGGVTVDGMQQPESEALIASLAASVTSARRLPLYEQLAAAIEQAMQSGQLGPGAILPREPDLAKQLGLSRQTVSQALNALARRGLLVRRKGVGTFVAERPIEQPLDRLYSFVRTLSIDGEPPAARLLGARLTAESDLATRLGRDPDELIFEISRLFSIDDAPFAYERIYLPASLGEQLPTAGLATSVIYELLDERCGIVVTHGEETLRITALSRSDAAILQRPTGDPAFLVERVAFAGDAPVEVRQTLVRGDRSRFRVRLAGPFLTPLLEPANP